MHWLSIRCALVVYTLCIGLDLSLLFDTDRRMYSASGNQSITSCDIGSLSANGKFHSDCRSTLLSRSYRATQRGLHAGRFAAISRRGDLSP